MADRTEIADNVRSIADAIGITEDQARRVLALVNETSQRVAEGAVAATLRSIADEWEDDGDSAIEYAGVIHDLRDRANALDEARHG